MSLLFQIKTEHPPLLFCLLISGFLSSVSIKPMTTMLVFLRRVGRWVGGVFVGVRACVGVACLSALQAPWALMRWGAINYLLLLLSQCHMMLSML